MSMSTYEVALTGTVDQVVYVEASSPEEAKQKAPELAMAEEPEAYDWQVFSAEVIR